MNERLTPEEIKLASKYIKRYERDAKTVKYARWVILLIALVIVTLSIKLMLQSHEIGQKNTTEYIAGKKNAVSNILDRYIDARLNGAELKTDILSEYIDARMDMLRIEFIASFNSYTAAIMGGLMIGVFIATLFIPGKNRLQAKALRMMIALSKDDQEDKSSNNNVQMNADQR